MKRILAALGVTSLALFGASATANATGGASGDNEKITICHATGSETNPYVPITIDLNGLNGHVGHQHDEDIIPANNGKVLPGGQNLDKVDWWNAGCTKPGGAVTPTPKPTHPHDDNGKKISICHATGSETNPYVVITIALQGLNGHAGAHHQHAEDIIPPNDGKVMPAGQNWTAEGQATWNNDCVPVKVPPTTPPTTPPTVPPTVTPTTPPTGAVVPAPKPSGAAVGKPAGGAGAVTANNQGFNVQTAVAGNQEPGIAPWLGGAAALLLAGAAIAARKSLAGGGTQGRHHQ
ncbi:hypothetical protein ACJJV6_19470 [Arthrobacter nitrophenolicus]|uniref:hypothetical protein n=1 Tax=Arthrobacter nitrophenolicus TaxID=683150 RepID=UPI003899827D